jgi:hypothetical protein
VIRFAAVAEEKVCSAWVTVHAFQPAASQNPADEQSRPIGNRPFRIDLHLAPD